jgi:chorismate mutase
VQVSGNHVPVPGEFEGIGSIGLEWLKRAKAETGLPTAVEVATG